MVISLADQILDDGEMHPITRKKPAWLRAKLPGGAGYIQLKDIIDGHQLHTVCQSAKCPNMGECWAQGTATIMILGDVCTRSCGFCNIATGRPPEYDTDEPYRVAESVKLMNLKHVVITSVNRDELPDGGAAIWAQTIQQIRDTVEDISIEVLIPDFAGNWDALNLVLNARPDVLNHNMETVRRLYPAVRPQAKYGRSIEVLRRSKQFGLTTKSGIMVGIGETDDEINHLMQEVYDGSNCDILTIGQYLQPTRTHLPIDRWVTPDQFTAYKSTGEKLGIGHVESGPLVRSSYHARQQVDHLGSKTHSPA